MKWTQEWHHSGTSCLGKYAAMVVYGGYGLTYRATYLIYCMVNVQQVNLSECKGRKHLKQHYFRVYLTYMGLLRDA